MKRHGLRLAATLAPLALALGACKSVGPDYTLPQQAYVNAPLANHALDDANGTLVSRDAVPGNWWQLYDDPVLNEAVRDALKSNTDLRVAAANLARSRAALKSQASRVASGGAEAAVQRARESAEQYLLENKLPVVNEGTVGINVSYEIDLFGKLRRGVEAARRTAPSGPPAALAHHGRRRRRAGVRRVVLGRRRAGRREAVARAAEAARRASQRLRDAGRGNQTDVTRGVTSAHPRRRYPALRRPPQGRAIPARRAARTFAGRPKAVAECERRRCASRFRSATAPRCCAAARRARSRAAFAAATARIGVATAALYPSISIGASAGSVGVAADLFSSTTNRWSFGPLISWSFPVNGQRARVREAEATTAVRSRTSTASC